MSSFTNYLNVQVLDQLFGAQDYAESGTLFIALSTGTDTGNLEGGTGFNEPPTASGYDRVSVTNDKTTWSNATTADPSVVQNDIVISFPQASGPWGTVDYFGIWDRTGVGADSGNLLAFGVLDTPRGVVANDTVSFAASNLTITLD